jgi:hypothetical protein
MKRYLFAVIFLCQVMTGFAQYGRGDFNHIGISLGINQTDLFTDSFNVTPQTSWTGGLAIRGNYYNSFAMVYGMNFTDNRFAIETNTLSATKEVDVSLMAVQIHLLLSYRILESAFSIDFGPVLQVNSELKYDASDENFFLTNNELLQIKDLEKITPFNFNVQVGITGGFENVRLNVSYQYGVTNMLNNINKQEGISARADGNLKGHIGVLAGNIIFYF